MSAGAAQLVAAVRAWLTEPRAGHGLVVAIDGYGASGKTTIAAAAARELGAVTIHTDDFFRPAAGTDQAAAGTGRAAAGSSGVAAGTGAAAAGTGGVAAGTPATQAPMARYYDWAALRKVALEPALAAARGAILLEGVSSSCPALADLVQRTVFVETPEPVRLARLRLRVSAQEWDEEWLAAEREYFATRPPERFDLIVPGFTNGEPCP